MRKHLLTLAGLAFCAALLLRQGTGEAAIGQRNAALNAKATYNPVPEAGSDIELPMPCGLKMVVRPVAVPGTLINDRRFSMGIGEGDNPDRQLYERRFEGHIAAPFERKNLPQDWQGKLGVSKDGNYTFYFMGKYEVSQAQWDSVMKALDENGEEVTAQCPKPSTETAMPTRSISWFDMQQFLKRYNSWLVKNHKQNLPSFGAKNIGFLRLPTEEEWEYAARGGMKVREEYSDTNDIFPLADGKELRDYGVFAGQQSLQAPLPIGSRLPNPLGLHDTVGNVREMVDGFFRLTIADQNVNGESYQRLHGASGGVLCKGGSYLSSTATVLPGWRDEVALYTSDGEVKPNDLGFRIALAGLNFPDSDRSKTLASENRAAQTAPPVKKEPAQAQKPESAPVPAPAPAQPTDDTQKVTLNRNGNLLQEFDRMSESTQNPVMQGNLRQFRGMLQTKQQAESRQREANVEYDIRSLLYQAEAIRSSAFRIEHLEDIRKANKELPAVVKKIEESERKVMKIILDGTNFYKKNLSRLAAIPPSELHAKLSQLDDEFRGGTDMLSVHMSQNLEHLTKHVNTVRTKGPEALSTKQICRDIIPEEHQKGMQKYL